MRIFYLISIVFICFVFLFSKAEAKKRPDFIFPVACSLGENCWSVKYVDVDPTSLAKDFQCGANTNDDHKGTDFAVKSLKEVKDGIAVLAAKEGKITRIRNSESDSIKTQKELDDIVTAKRECGNAVFINHGSGLYTLYCHLKKDSISVSVGQKVSAGQKIAEIGHSGLTEFPHLHFGVVWEGGIVDPYTGALNTEGCENLSTKNSLWAPGQKIDYTPFSIYDLGFRGEIPNFEKIKAGQQNPENLSINTKDFVFWAAFYGVSAGDEIHLKVLGPDGNVFAQRHITQEKNRARQYYYTGRKLAKMLKSGTYIGTASINRHGHQKQLLRQTIQVE